MNNTDSSTTTKSDSTRHDENNNQFENFKEYENDYNIIKDSSFFDEEYYLKNYPEVKDSGMDSILHYIVYGAQKGYNPSKAFSTKRYIQFYPDVAKANINPFSHFIKNGRKENRRAFAEAPKLLEDLKNSYSNKEVNNIVNSLNRKVSIIIPIFNAYDEVRKCIRSVLLNTSIDYELILINDCSTDERIGELLDLVGVLPFVRVVNNEVNQGFVKNVNLGIGLSKFDVVLLNSDTVVTPRWFPK